jgi:hypothetical protein
MLDVQRKHVLFSMLLLAQVPCGVLSGGEFFDQFVFWSPSTENSQWILLMYDFQECLDAVIFVIEEISGVPVLLS